MRGAAGWGVTAPGLALLRERIRAAKVPAAEPGNLRIATWNIREFGKSPRMGEAIVLIAEILRCFDVISIVELRDDTGDLRRVLDVLGGKWAAVFSDYLPDHAGNRERVGFVFNAERVRFTGLAATAAEPREEEKRGYRESVPWWRLPFVASFAAGDFHFLCVAAHLRWGSTVGGRRDELTKLCAWASARRAEKYWGSHSILLLGDFNLPVPDDAVFTTLAAMGFHGAPGMANEPGTDLAEGKRYDRILCLPQDDARFTGRGGALDFYAGSFAPLFPHHDITKAEFTWQLSDHLPLWAELGTGRAGNTE